MLFRRMYTTPFSDTQPRCAAGTRIGYVSTAVRPLLLCGQALLVLLFLAVSTGRAAATERVVIAASIAPLADFAGQIGQGRVDVITLVPPGASPHTYELKPSQVVKVAEAQLLILNGAGLEYWADKLVEVANNPSLEVVDTSAGISLIDTGDHGANPHIWLDVRQAIMQVRHIRDALVRVDAGAAEQYRANAQSYISQLVALDREIEAELRGWTSRQFVAFHPAWVYFARRYDLKQVAVVVESPGREPSPVDIVRVIETARQIGARAIFAEPQFSSKAAEAIAEESGAKLVFLDPLGSQLSEFSYLDLMRANVTQMRSMMK